jgi:hypothetical protein
VGDRCPGEPPVPGGAGPGDAFKADEAGADAQQVRRGLPVCRGECRQDGGWGVDALVGRQTRPHQDLDLVIARDDLAAAQQTLAPAGFTHDATAVPGLPAWLVLVDVDGRQVDLHRYTMADSVRGSLDGSGCGAAPARCLLAGVDHALVSPRQLAQRVHELWRVHDGEVRVQHSQIEGEHLRMVRARLERASVLV